MIPGCVTSGRSGKKVHFSNILSNFGGSFASESGGVGSCGRWGSHTQCAWLSPPQLRIFNRWCLLCTLFYAANTGDPGDGHTSIDPSSSAHSLTTLILLCAQVLSFHAIHPTDSFMGYVPPLVAHLIVAFAES